MSRTKPAYRVKDAKLIKVKDYWPQYANSEHAERQVLLCYSDGACLERGLKDGHEIRTSLIETVSEDKTVVETLNSKYLVSSWLNS